MKNEDHNVVKANANANIAEPQGHFASDVKTCGVTVLESLLFMSKAEPHYIILVTLQLFARGTNFNII